MMRHALGVILLFVVGSAQAATVSIDFEDLPADGAFSTPLLTQGFVIDPALAPNQPAIFDDWSGSGTGHELGLCGFCAPGPTEGISIYRADATTFELDSFDLRFWTKLHTGTVTGYLAGGGTVTQALSIAGIINFDQSWVNLTSIDIVIDSNLVNPSLDDVTFMDNFTLQAVPVPAAAWLFGSGLGLLGWLRRRQTA